jgi:hypothetical protein
MIDVLIWLPSFNVKGMNVGHAALQIGFSDYVSFWPGYFKDFLKNPAMSPIFHSYREDVEAEGGPPDHVVRLYSLGEEAMSTAWHMFKNSGRRYDLFNLNCSSVILELLITGYEEGNRTVINPFREASILLLTLWHRIVGSGAEGTYAVLRFARAIEDAES